MRKILTIILLLASGYLNAQVNHNLNCDTIRVNANSLYKILNKKQLHISHTENRKPLKRISIGKTKFKFNIALIDSEMNILSYEQKSYINNPPRYQRNYLKIQDKIILIDSLYFGDTLPNDYTFMTYFYKSYSFEFGKRKYKALFANNARDNTSLPNTLLILLDVTKKNCFNIVLSEIQACSDLSCLGDFNSDGNLDYLYWGIGNYYTDSVSFYTLNEAKTDFIQDERYYIKLLESDQWGEYLIDVNKSTFFYNICPNY